MYGIFTNISTKNHPNVGKYTMHGAYGNQYRQAPTIHGSSWHSITTDSPKWSDLSKSFIVSRCVHVVSRDVYADLCGLRSSAPFAAPLCSSVAISPEIFVPAEAMGVRRSLRTAHLILSLTAECQIRQNAEGKDLETSSDIQCSPQTVAARLKMKGQRTKKVGVFTLTKTQLLEDKSPFVTVFNGEITIFHHQTSLHPSITQHPPVAEALSP